MPTVTVPQAFALALQHHQAGRLAEAEALYRQILAAQPDHPEALHHLGLIAHQVGRHGVAVGLIRRALVFLPHSSSAHSDLGEACRAAGRFDEAVSHFHRAIQLQPDLTAAHYNLGNAHHERGQFDQAITAYRRALQFQPDMPEAYNNLGNSLKAQGQLDEAVAAYRQAIQLRPGYPEARNNLGVTLTGQGRFDEAVTELHRTLQLQPDDPSALLNLGNALTAQRHFTEATAAYRRALELKPGYAAGHYNLGNVLKDQGRLDEAIAAYQRAINFDPNFAKAHNNLSDALMETRRFDEAMAACHAALHLQPDYAHAKFNLSVLSLRNGDFAQGWPLWEARWEAFRCARRHFPQPAWDGRELHGQRVLVHAEQGCGDSIQFVRYAPLIAARGGEVIVECQPSLIELFRGTRGVSEVVAAGDPLPSFDRHVPMLSLPLVFQTTRESIPREVPYLSAEPARRATWRQRLGGERSRPRVGLAWAGNPQNVALRKRDIDPAKLLPLLHLEGIDFFSLQMDRAAGDLRPIPGTSAVIDHTEHLRDFADTAAFMAELDLIISVDTAVAHLAGALGRPVWTLLSFVADWRWGLESEANPWYPTMRLFRQPGLGDWDTVAHRVFEELNRARERKFAPAPR